MNIERFKKGKENFKDDRDQVLQWLLEGNEEFKLQMLGRMDQDCEYYVTYGNRNKNVLWAFIPEDQIYFMKEIYKSLKNKPTWLTMEQIEEHERNLLK